MAACKRVPLSPISPLLTIQVERQLERLEARRQTSLLLARCHTLQAALERSETANHAQRLGQLATPSAAAARQPLSTARTTGVLAPTSRGGSATYYVDEAEEHVEDTPAAGSASVANSVSGTTSNTSYGPRNVERRPCEMYDRARRQLLPPEHAEALLPNRQGSSTYYVDEGDEEEPARRPVMLSRHGSSSTYHVEEGDESEEEPAGSSVVPNRQSSSTYYVDEGAKGEEGKEEPTWPPVPAGGVLSSVSCRLLLYGEPKLVSFEADLSRDTASGLALELVCEFGLDEDETTLREIERQIGIALKAGLAAQPDRASLMCCTCRGAGVEPPR